MRDEIILENQTSRVIKFNTTDAPLPEGAAPTDLVTWSRLKQFLNRTDGLSCDIAINTAGDEIPGTPLNQTTLLSDAAETAIWGSASGTSRTPSDAFVELGSKKVNKSGDTITGPLAFQGQSEQGIISVNEYGDFHFKYENGSDAPINCGNIFADEINGTSLKAYSYIDANNKRIINVTTPESNTDAVNKGYVDEKFNQALEAGAVVFITATMTRPAQGIIDCSATFDQIIEYLDNGKYVVVKYYQNPSTQYPYYGLVVRQESNKIDFLIKAFNYDKILRCSKSGNDTNLYLYNREPLKVEIARVAQTGGPLITINTSFAEILDAYNNNRQIIAKSAGIYGGAVTFNSTTERNFDVTYNSSLNTFTFSMLCISYVSADTSYYALREIKFILDSNDTITFDNGATTQIKSA